QSFHSPDRSRITNDASRAEYTKKNPRMNPKTAARPREFVKKITSANSGIFVRNASCRRDTAAGFEAPGTTDPLTMNLRSPNDPQPLASPINPPAVPRSPHKAVEAASVTKHAAIHPALSRIVIQPVHHADKEHEAEDRSKQHAHRHADGGRCEPAVKQHPDSCEDQHGHDQRKPDSHGKAHAPERTFVHRVSGR